LGPLVVTHPIIFKKKTKNKKQKTKNKKQKTKNIFLNEKNIIDGGSRTSSTFSDRIRRNRYRGDYYYQSSRIYLPGNTLLLKVVEFLYGNKTVRMMRVLKGFATLKVDVKSVREFVLQVGTLRGAVFKNERTPIWSSGKG
jgi:hypothetical protein